MFGKIGRTTQMPPISPEAQELQKQAAELLKEAITSDKQGLEEIPKIVAENKVLEGQLASLAAQLRGIVK